MIPTPDGWQAVAGAAVRLPASAQRLVLERVSPLGDTAADALAQASVLGQEFSYDRLQALTGLGEETLVSVLERAMEADILVDRTGVGEERYAFADAYLYEVLHGSLSAPRRRQLHRRAGEVAQARSVADAVPAPPGVNRPAGHR